MTTHIGQGFAVPKGETYSSPDRQDLARKATQRLLEQKEARRAAREANEERDRRTLALGAGWQAVVARYRELGGRGTLPPGIQWCPEPDPDEDPFEGIDGNGKGTT